MNSPAPSHSNATKTVLVVEDNEMYRSVVVAALGHYLPGFAVAEAGSVKEAVKALASGPVEVVVVDMTLPDGTAINLIDASQGLIQKGLKFVIVSALSLADMEPILNRSDVAAYVEKSQGPKALAAAILAT
jgi:DNA-binding NtrC family response regulator